MPRAYNAEIDDEDRHAESSGSEDPEDDDDATAYTAQSCAPPGEFEDIEDAIEQDVVCAFLAANCDLNDKAICAEIADAVHGELAAFAAREQAAKRGVPTQRVVHPFRPPQSELTLDQRRARVDLAKKNSTCRGCGQPGHWAADEICP